MSGLGDGASGVGVAGAGFLDLEHQPADVLPLVARQLHHVGLLHAVPYGVSHGDGERGAGGIGAVLGVLLGAHRLAQGSDGLLGGGHVDMFAHRGGHTEARPYFAISILARGHINVASWVLRIKGVKSPFAAAIPASPKDHDMAVSKRMRYEILRRDNHACRYCGAAAPDVKLNVDHVIPTSLGGSDKPDNLATACADCNGGKTSSMPNAMTVEDVDQDTFRHAAELARTQPDMAAVRAAFHAHLIAVWCWAWNSRSHTEPTEEQEGEAFERLAILADGSDFTSEQLTQIAFDAGSARSTEAARFVAPQLSNEQFSLGADAVNLWWAEWETANQGAGPSADETAEFCDGLHALVILLDASAQRAMVMRAASRAGQRMDTNIVRHLSEPIAQP